MENCLINFEERFRGLGPKQKLALYYYLLKTELIYRKEQTEFYKFVKRLFENKKNYWGYLWTNLFFNTELFKWWGNVKKGTYSRKQLLEALINFSGSNNKSVISGLNSILSTLEYTPIGSELKIGIVTREKNKRYVKKEGGYPFDPYVVLYALYKYAHRKQIFRIDIGGIENEIYSPQKVLVIESRYVKKVLLEIDEPELLQTNAEEDRLIAILNQTLHPYEVIKRYIQKERL
ncbi:MAG: hypothetical protein N2317_06755 [Syntrophales bacterium]|nr:hypothetical protein [Syntrophales bacterium]